MPGPVIIPGFGAIRRVTWRSRRFGDAGDQVVARLPALLGIAPVDLEVLRVAAPEDTSRPPVPWRPAGAVRLESRPGSCAYSKALRGSAKRAKSASVCAWRGPARSRRARRARAPRRGEIQMWCTVSAASCEPSWPAGARATKKRVSKRRERSGRGDPVAVVGERAGGNVQVLAFQQLEERLVRSCASAARALGEHRRVRSRRRRAARRPPRSTRVPRRPNRRARRSESQPLVRLRLGEAEHAARRPRRLRRASRRGTRTRRRGTRRSASAAASAPRAARAARAGGSGWRRPRQLGRRRVGVAPRSRRAAGAVLVVLRLDHRAHLLPVGVGQLVELGEVAARAGGEIARRRRRRWSRR